MSKQLQLFEGIQGNVIGEQTISAATTETQVDITSLLPPTSRGQSAPVSRSPIVLQTNPMHLNPYETQTRDSVWSRLIRFFWSYDN